MLKIIVSIGVIFLLIVIFARHTHICTGGKLMQGCHKILWPWSKKVTLTVGGERSYCCLNCLKRDISLYTGEGGEQFVSHSQGSKDREGLGGNPKAGAAGVQRRESYPLHRR